LWGWERFTAPESKPLWPQATAHTQWPGSGTKGDPTFDTFFASQVETIGDEAMIEQLNRDAGTALLDRIGPAILIAALAVVSATLPRPATRMSSGNRLALHYEPFEMGGAKRTHQ